MEQWTAPFNRNREPLPWIAYLPEIHQLTKNTVAHLFIGYAISATRCDLIREWMQQRLSQDEFWLDQASLHYCPALLDVLPEMLTYPLSLQALRRFLKYPELRPILIPYLHAFAAIDLVSPDDKNLNEFLDTQFDLSDPQILLRLLKTMRVKGKAIAPIAKRAPLDHRIDAMPLVTLREGLCMTLNFDVLDGVEDAIAEKIPKHLHFMMPLLRKKKVTYTDEQLYDFLRALSTYEGPICSKIVTTMFLSIAGNMKNTNLNLAPEMRQWLHAPYDAGRYPFVWLVSHGWRGDIAPIIRKASREECICAWILRKHKNDNVLELIKERIQSLA